MQEKEVLKTKLHGLRWLRWFVTFIFALGIGLSVLLQVLHAPAAGGVVAKIIGGVPPVAVFLCVEMIARIPILQKLAGWVRIAIAAAVAGMAIVVSYEQQYDYVLSLAFTGISVILFPLIIDGVMFVATLSLVEVTRQVRNLKEQIAALSAPPIPVPAPVEQPPVAVQAPEPMQPEPTAAPAPEPRTPARNGRKPGPQEPPTKRRAGRQRFLGSGGILPVKESDEKLSDEELVQAIVIEGPEDGSPVARGSSDEIRDAGVAR